MIEADALLPERAYSGNLYSVEFFQPCARAAEAGRHDVHLGAHAARRTRPSARAFPHVLEVDSGVILIGSRYPIQIDVKAWEARLLQSEAYLGELRALTIREKLRNLAPASGPLEGLPNRDLFPRDEFGRR